jgi:hypothetical protein
MATFKYHLNHPYKKGTRELKKEPVLVDGVFTISREHRFVISTSERIQPKYWDRKEKAVKSSFTGHHEINKRLLQIKERVMIAWGHWTAAGGTDLEQLKKAVRVAVKGEIATAEKKTLFIAFDKLLEIYDKEKDSKTTAKFKTLRAYLQKFDEQEYPITFEGMSFQFYDDFKAFLYRQPNQTHPDSFFHDQGDYWTISKEKSAHPVGLFDDTIYKHIINLKIFLEWARKRDYPVHKSFSDWPIIQREYEPIALTLSELEALEKVAIPERHIDAGRDYLCLECRTGQRISDLKRFDMNDYDNYRWSFKQYKGRGLRRKEETMTVFFNGYSAPALLILAKHNFKMPAISEQKLNKNLRLACKAAGIDQEMFTERWVGNKCVRFYGKKYEFISTHTGRKTFITIGLQYMKPEVVMNLTGIKSYQTLKKYKAKSEPEILQQALDQAQDSITLMRKAQ